MSIEMELIKKIEILRYELELVAKKEGMRSAQTLLMSQKLDEALNQYYRFMQNKYSII